MKSFSTLIVLLLVFTIVNAQQNQIKPKISGSAQTETLPLLDEEMLEPLRTLVPISVPPIYSGPNAPLLPIVLDNSALPFFRPAYNQDGLSCGQASFVGYMFTYEMNRVRNLAGNIPANQYPTHFAWNWVNGGNGWYGASYFHSADMLRHVGTPNVQVYGGMSAGGGTRWMSGYNDYYHAMHNRIHDAYSIDVSTPEGLQILKHYLNDHLEGSDHGGVATFYANPPPLYSLPAGTPEAGKKVAVSWNSANHAMTIVGYHDSIRWDYNNDGQYTNHVDINGDGVVDMRDWEIGGLKMVNSYGGVPNWGDGGFCYMMYKTLADPYGGGGIWNNAVHVLTAKTNMEPQLTMKVTLKHNLREQIKVTAGLSLDPNASSPTIEMDFPIFHYQGDLRPMQGEFNEESKTIEFGLDITPLLSHVPSGQTARYFLRVYEKDPNGTGTGDILAFSLMDYTNGVNEIDCPNAPVPLVNNGKTTLWVNAALTYNTVQISNQSIPGAQVYEPYSTQLEATGGTPPYHWSFKMDYEESLSTQTFPIITSQQLTPTSNSNGYATKKLDFSFPFYGELFDTLFIHVNGVVLFDRQLYPWPYQNEPMILFKGYKGIAPYNFDLRLYSGQGIWYEGDENSATFRWKASLNGNQSTELNFAVKLFPSGDIEYYYGNMLFPAGTEWIGGLSSGDYRNYQLLSFTADPSVQPNKKVVFDAPDFAHEMSLSPDGTFHGTPTRVYDNCLLTFMVTDNNNLFATKTLALNTTGLIIDYALQAGTNSILEFGETATMDIIIKSMEPAMITNATMTLTTNDPFITMIDSIYQISSLAPGDSVVFAGAFSFTVSDQVSNHHLLGFDLDVTSSADSWSRQLSVYAFAPVVNLTHALVLDCGNGILDQGETTDIAIFLKNSGGALLSDITIALSSLSPEITINTSQATINSLPANSGQYAVFNITATNDLIVGQVINLAAAISGHNNYQANGEIIITTLIIGENFESGDFNVFPWQFSGNQPWVIDTASPYEGTYSATSGTINDNQTSVMEMTMIVAVDDSISFYRKVSSEASYDFLKFFVNGVLKGQWSGNVPWDRVVYPLTAGSNTLKWVYEKDNSVSNGSDCAWVDYILFPEFLSANAGINGQICEGETFTPNGSATNYSSIEWTTDGSGSFDDPHILCPVYTPGESDKLLGEVVLTLTVQHSNNPPLEVVSDEVLLSVVMIPGIGVTPSGPDSVDLLLHSSSIYSTEALPQAMNYSWVLEPASAGSISGTGTTATVQWNSAFTGYATIKVCGSNVCGIGGFSETKSTWVYVSTVGFELPENADMIRIAPNPSSGLFRLHINSHNGLPFSIAVFNTIGNVVYHNEGLTMTNGTYEINLENSPQGMYVLVFRSNNITLHKKLVIGK